MTANTAPKRTPTPHEIAVDTLRKRLDYLIGQHGQPPDELVEGLDRLCKAAVAAGRF